MEAGVDASPLAVYKGHGVRLEWGPRVEGEVGFRPEDVEGVSGPGGTVVRIEGSGADRIVRVRLCETGVRIRLSRADAASRGETLEFRLDPRRLHLFVQGRRLPDQGMEASQK